MREVADVEERDRRAPVRAVVVTADADRQQIRFAERMDVRREAGDLELADELRRLVVAQVDGEQRVDVAERDDERFVLEEARAHDALALRDPADVTDGLEVAAFLL